MKTDRQHRKHGFTLLEIMMVVAIMGLLLATAIRLLGPQLGVARVARARGDMDAIATALVSYQGMTGYLPSSGQGLQALVTPPSGDPPAKNWVQCMERVPLDPWGKPYQYANPSTHNNPRGYDIWCTDQTGKPIGNWDE